MVNLSVVMPVLNNLSITEEAVISLFTSSKHLKQLIIIDDCSAEDYGPLISKLNSHKNEDMDDIVYYKFESPEGVTKAWNKGIELAKYEYIAIVNNDIVATNNWDKVLIEKLNDDVWISCPFHTRHGLPGDFPIGSERHTNSFGNFLGCCFMMKTDTWEKLGPIDERIKIWFNDNWIINRVVKDFNKQIAETNESYVHHYYSRTCNNRAKAGFSRIVAEDNEQFKIISSENAW